MPIEIERKFLLKNDSWKNSKNHENLILSSDEYKQGYMLTDSNKTIRVRIAGDKGFITIKGKTIGSSRSEYEYEIPINEANEMLEIFCERPFIEKVRYLVSNDQNIWEIDVFKGDNSGLIIAELELESEDQKISLPEWIGEEVTGIQKYYNSSLTKYPFSIW